MKGKKLLVYFVVLFFSLASFSGCADLMQKITRKKKEPPKPIFYSPPVRKSNEQLYKEHYVYWKSWHQELIKDLGGNHKKELQDVYQARRHLDNLQKYVREEKAEEARSYLDQFDKLTADLKKDRLSQMENSILRRRLETLQLRIEKNMSFSEAKPYLLPSPPPIDLSEYEDEEWDDLDEEKESSGTDESVAEETVELTEKIVTETSDSGEESETEEVSVEVKDAD